MPDKRTITCLHFSDRERTLLQSLLRGIGLHSAIHWHFTDHDNADVVLIEWDHSGARLGEIRRQFPRSRLVAYTELGEHLGDVCAILRKPLRARELERLLTGLEELFYRPAPPAEALADIPVLLQLNGRQ